MRPLCMCMMSIASDASLRAYSICAYLINKSIYIVYDLHSAALSPMGELDMDCGSPITAEKEGG